MATYLNLVTDIPLYLMNNSEQLSSALSSIILNAEYRLSRDANVIGYNTTVTGTFTVGSNQLSRPTDLLRPIYLSVTSGTESTLMQIKTQPFVLEYEPNSASAYYGLPIYYSPNDFTSFLITPRPDAAYAYTLNYQQRLSPLDGTNSSNWYTVYAYDALLYACLADGARFVLDDKQQFMVQMYETRYQQAVQQINSMDHGAERDDTRVPVLDADNR